MNIDEISAGRELDALIAEKVMGWHVSRMYAAARYWDPSKHDPIHYSCDEPNEVPCYSTDRAVAWEVVEHTLVHDKRLLQFRAEIVSGGKYQYAKFVDCGDSSAPVYGARAASMPLAICRAALKLSRSA